MSHRFETLLHAPNHSSDCTCRATRIGGKRIAPDAEVTGSETTTCGSCYGLEAGVYQNVNDAVCELIDGDLRQSLSLETLHLGEGSEV